MADLVLAFSEWSADQVRRVSPGATVRRAYLGVNLEKFQPGPKEQLVACVANVNRENIARKGLRTFAQAASLVPEAKFVLVGRWLDETADHLRAIATPNLTLTGWVDAAELRDILSRAKVYCQVSYTEGFGLALAEAMASGCVPIVCPAGAIPEVVGEIGFYVAYGDELGLARAVRQGLRSSLGQEARDRVQRLFPEDHRLNELRSAIQDLQRGGLSRLPTMPTRPYRGGRVRR